MDSDVELFAREQLPQLLRRAYLLTRTQHDAEDLAQETLLKVCAHWRTVSGSREPAKYVNRMMINLFLDQRRVRRTSLVALDERHGHVSSAVDESEAVDQRAVLLQALGEISPRERTAVVLRHYEHMDIAEIAECMELVESSVRATLSRAMNHLRTTMTALNHY